MPDDPSSIPSQKDESQRVYRRPKIIIAAHLPPSVGGPASLLINIFSSDLVKDFELIPFNIGRPPKFSVQNNFGYKALFNAGLRRVLVAIWITLYHVMKFPAVLLKERPTLVHIHTAPYWVFWETAWYVLVSKLFSVPCALQMHFSFRFFYEDSPWFFRRIMLWILRMTSVFVVICNDDIFFLKELGANDINVTYLPNFVDVKNIQYEIKNIISEKSCEGLLEVLFLGGSDSIRKGLRELLLTVPSVVKYVPNVRYRLVAVPKSIVSELVPDVYQNMCIVEGWLSGRQKYERFASADIFVLPTHAEGMPVAILEAMAGAIPVVASNVAGIPDMITNEKEGFLIPCKDVPMLTTSIITLLKSKRLRIELGNRAAERALDAFDISVGINNFKKLYSGMVTGKNNI